MAEQGGIQMKIWAIIPIKRLANSKTRLSTVLDGQARAALTLTLYRRLVDVLQEVTAVQEILIVSRDHAVTTIAEQKGVCWVQEEAGAELNGSIVTAVHYAMAQGATQTLILPSDLPLVTAVDINNVIKQHQPNTLTICGDQKQMGTNALLLPIQPLFKFRYGINSFEQHLTEACKWGLQVNIVDIPRIQFDLDTVEDWHTYQSIKLNDPSNVG